MMKQELSIKGWLEVDEESIPDIKNLISNQINNYEKYSISYSKALTYGAGWCFQDSKSQSVHHVFLGLYIRLSDVPFIKEIIQGIAVLSTETDGVFFVIDNETGEFSEKWFVEEGIFRVTKNL